jgi:hypothetical protein
VLTKPEPLLPTRGYRVLCTDATLIDLEAEGMWPMGTQLKFTVTTLVIGSPRQVVVHGADAPTSTSCCATTEPCGRRCGLRRGARQVGAEQGAGRVIDAVTRDVGSLARAHARACF